MIPMFDHMVASTVTWARLRARRPVRAHLAAMMMFTTLTQVLTMQSERGPGVSRDH